MSPGHHPRHRRRTCPAVVELNFPQRFRRSGSPQVSQPRQVCGICSFNFLIVILTKSKLGFIKHRVLTNLNELLRRHGVQVTAQRLAVLRVVARRPHCTADDIANEVRAEIGAISRQAVYDALGLLVEKGLIRRIQPAGSPALYEDRVDDNHHHAICRKCGKTADIDCAVGEAPCLKASNNSGFQIDEAEVIYWGTCPDCLAKK